ncbi:hypothetical protein IW262DRAFT_1292315 [Armillaria fumosa]|nr:hypothetical protein IW262DRAFT_1292315 [Armillaria fumosa]
MSIPTPQPPSSVALFSKHEADSVSLFASCRPGSREHLGMTKGIVWSAETRDWAAIELLEESEGWDRDSLLGYVLFLSGLANVILAETRVNSGNYRAVQGSETVKDTDSSKSAMNNCSVRSVREPFVSVLPTQLETLPRGGEGGGGGWELCLRANGSIWDWRDEYSRDRDVWTRSIGVVYIVIVVDNIVVCPVLVRFAIWEGVFVLLEAALRVWPFAGRGRTDEIAEESVFWVKGAGGLSVRKAGLFHQRRWHDLRIIVPDSPFDTSWPDTLRARVADLHAAFNLASPDSTLLTGPQRVHLILGVMNLTTEPLPTALDLLHRLPTLLSLTAAPPTIASDTLNVLKKESRCCAHPEPLFNKINQIFRDEGFITDTRPLKLHMTLMNSTYRRPRTIRPQPFEYDAILRQAGVSECFGVQESEYAEVGRYDGLVRGAEISESVQDGKLEHGRRDGLPLEDDTLHLLCPDISSPPTRETAHVSAYRCSNQSFSPSATSMRNPVSHYVHFKLILTVESSSHLRAAERVVATPEFFGVG